MNSSSDEGRGTEGSARAASKRSTDATMRGTRPARATRRYMIAPTDAGVTAAVVAERLRDLGGAEIIRTLEPRSSGLPPIIVIRTTPENAAILRRTGVPNAGGLLVERDHALLPATAMGRLGALASRVTAVPLGPAFATTVQVQGDNEQAVEGAIVQLIGAQWSAEGMTGRDGKVNLTLFGELPGRPLTLLVRPRAGFWGLCRENWDPQADGNTVALRPLTLPQELPWGGRAMGFDQLPPDYRGGGIRIALIDTGVATSHRQLAAIKQGKDVSAADAQGWAQDPAGHGTPAAAILVAAPDKESAIRGYAPGAELDVCKLGLDAHCSDLAAALDYCIEKEVDIACIGFGSQRGSAILEQRFAAAKRRGIAMIAAAGSDGGVVQFPASSRQVLAVGAIGRSGTFPDDGLESVVSNAPQNELALAADSGLFVPTFSCGGPEIDLCAPGVAIMSCQSPDGYAACSGTSFAAPHVAALAALLLAHRDDLRIGFAQRDSRRVERLFQVLKETAQPLGDPLRTGAGLPNAVRALGIQSAVFAPQPVAQPLASRVSDMRRAMRFAGLDDPERLAEPPRGPAMIGQAQFTSPPEPAGSGGPKRGADVRILRQEMTRAGLAANS